MKQLVALAVMAVASGVAGAEAFELKGYTIGAPIADCPEGTIKRGGKAPEIDCHLGPTTLANTPVEHIIVSLYEGKISSVLFFLSDKGQYANSAVRDALTEKFGAPTSAKTHVNQYHWLRAGQHMALNGWRGHLFVYDTAAQAQVKKAQQQTNKNDL